MTSDALAYLVQHTVQGTLWRTDSGVILVLGEPSKVFSGEALCSGVLTVRYGIPFLGPSQFAVIPSLLVSERGRTLKGWQAWDFMHEHYQIYARSEIFGLRSDGEAVQVFLRGLDFGAKSRVFVYASPQEYVPIARPASLLVAAGAVVPDLLHHLLI